MEAVSKIYLKLRYYFKLCRLNLDLKSASEPVNLKSASGPVNLTDYSVHACRYMYKVFIVIPKLTGTRISVFSKIPFDISFSIPRSPLTVCWVISSGAPLPSNAKLGAVKGTYI